MLKMRYNTVKDDEADTGIAIGMELTAESDYMDDEISTIVLKQYLALCEQQDACLTQIMQAMAHKQTHVSKCTSTLEAMYIKLLARTYTMFVDYTVCSIRSEREYERDPESTDEISHLMNIVDRYQLVNIFDDLLRLVLAREMRDARKLNIGLALKKADDKESVDYMEVSKRVAATAEEHYSDKSLDVGRMLFEVLRNRHEAEDTKQ